MRKALFLDRDGVLNREIGDYTFRTDDFELLSEVMPALKLAMQKQYLLVVISNQGGIAKGLYTKHDVETVHDKLRNELSVNGVELAEIYYCPHHNSIGKCFCRKPGSLLIEKAMARFQIDAAESVFIGDSPTDVEAARRAGVRGILIPSNSGIMHIAQQLP